jgi:hypothetical protein
MKIALSSCLRAVGLSGLAAGLAMAFASPAAAAKRAEIVPYLEVEQVLSADFNGGGDTLTYTSVAAGVDGRVTGKRVQAQVSYRYERRIAWEHDIADDDVHTGIAQARAEIVPNMLAIQGGALATRARGSGSGPFFGFNTADSRNLVDVYSIYAGPDFSTRAGGFDLAASYRLGYVKVDDNNLAGLPLPPGTFRPDRYNSSTNQTANFSIGMGPGTLPFGWTVSGGWAREDVNRLDQNYDAHFIRGDVIYPITPSVAVTGGVGYEKIKSSQQDILRGSDGLPVVTPGGNFIPDPSRPRLLSYDQSGVIWDAGVIWRPSRRTEVQARFGKRYGDMTYTGSFQHKFNSAYAITGSVYDTVDSFGRIIVADLASTPTNFRVNRNPLSQGVGGIGGCVFGTEAGQGTCFDDVVNGITNQTFRHRGANVLFSGGRGPWSMGIGASYAQRKYSQPSFGPGFVLDRVKDESFSLNGYVNRELSRTSGIGVDAYANWFDSSLPGVKGSFGTGIAGNYYRSLFYDRLQAQAAIGLFTTDSGSEDFTGAQALVGLRYSF